MKTPSRIFHGTSIRALLGVLADDTLRDDLGDDGHGAGVSFTSSVQIARKFAREAEEFSRHSDGPVEGLSCEGVVLRFAFSDLAVHPGLRPVQWDGVSTEREFRSHGPVVRVIERIDAIAIVPGDLAALDAAQDDLTEGHKAIASALKASLDTTCRRPPWIVDIMGLKRRLPPLDQAPALTI